MDIFATYAVNEEKESKGVWCEIGDSKFLVARAGNKDYVKMLTKEVNRNKRALDRKDAAAEKLNEELMVKIMAKTILLGWEDVEYKGKKLEYSVENAEMILAHDEFRRQIMVEAEDFSKFKAVQDEEDAKN